MPETKSSAGIVKKVVADHRYAILGKGGRRVFIPFKRRCAADVIDGQVVFKPAVGTRAPKVGDELYYEAKLRRRGWRATKWAIKSRDEDQKDKTPSG